MTKHEQEMEKELRPMKVALEMLDNANPWALCADTHEMGKVYLAVI